MREMKRAVVCSCLLVLVLAVAGQSVDSLQTQIYVRINTVEYEGDSITNVELPAFVRVAPMEFKNEKERERYNRMVKNVKQVFPLAQLARQTLIETYEYLQTLPSDEAKQEHIKRVERGVKEQYTPLVRKLSRSQGKLLIKLIDRECGQSSFQMVKAFLGPLRANFYQTVAGLFGASLSKRYDPEGDDKHIETIVKMLESGQM